MSETSALTQLESFIVGNDELEELENMIAEFNMFEVMGAIRQELRHSDFLAFMLNPSGKHGLGDKFLKRFLMRVLKETDVQIDVSAIHVDVLDLSGATVERESQHIDILVHDVKQEFVCVIENKIYSGEHSDQLNRYLDIAKKRFGNVKYFIPIFLSPDGTPPEDEDSPYIPVSYSLVHKTLETVRESNQASLGLSVNLMMEHYTTMLRRHIMTDSDIADLCRKIYDEHKDALDLIFQHMPDEREFISNLLVQLINGNQSLGLNWSGLSGVQFYPTEWLDIQELQVADPEVQPPALVLRLFFHIRSQSSVTLKLMILPSQGETVRQGIFDLLKQQPFALSSARLGKKWSTVYSKVFIKNYTDYSPDELQTQIEEQWNAFINHDLEQIKQVITDAQFE